MTHREQATAVKLLARWRVVAKAAKRMPKISAEERLELLTLFDELTEETDSFLEHEDQA